VVATDRTEQRPDKLLAEVAALRSQTRRRVRGAWLPLLVFGLLTLASIPLYSRAFDTPRCCGAFSHDYRTPFVAGLPGADSQTGAALFWLIAMPVAYSVCALWYHRRAAQRGLQPRWRDYVGLGLALFAFVVVVNLLPDRVLSVHPGVAAGSAPTTLGVGIRALFTPLVAVAAGLVVLAWVERSAVVAAAALVFGGLTVVVNTYGPGQQPAWFTRYPATRPWLVAPAHDLLLLSGVLLLGAVVAGPTARRAQRSA